MAEFYAPLVRRVAAQASRRFRGPLLEREDAEQVGTLGLFQAIERYDPSAGEFEPYAERRIRGAIADEQRSHDHAPRLARRIVNARDRLARELGRDPSEVELKAATGYTAHDLARSLAVTEVRHASLDDVVRDRKTRATDLAAPEDLDVATVRDELIFVSQEILSQLRPRTAAVLYLNVLAGFTLAEIGRDFGISESRACHIKRAALHRCARIYHLRDAEQDLRQNAARERWRRERVAPPPPPPPTPIPPPPPTPTVTKMAAAAVTPPTLPTPRHPRLSNFRPRACEECGAEFPPRSGRHRVCDTCRPQNLKRKPQGGHDGPPGYRPRVCGNCGATFQPTGAAARRCDECRSLPRQRPPRLGSRRVAVYRPKLCQRCGEEFLPSGPRSKWCASCHAGRGQGQLGQVDLAGPTG